MNYNYKYRKLSLNLAHCPLIDKSSFLIFLTMYLL